LQGFKNQVIYYGLCQFVFSKEYYLNSVADKVYINPVGEMDFKGLSSEIMYYKDLQESQV
jgi:hypothetical protein